MEVGRRISASRRPCSVRRVSARKRPPGADGFVNSVKKLQRREICSKRDRAFSMSNAQESFRNMRLIVCLCSFTLFKILSCHVLYVYQVLKLPFFLFASFYHLDIILFFCTSNVALMLKIFLFESL